MDEVKSSLLRGGSGGQSSAAYVAELVGEDADLSLCVARDEILSKQVRKVVARTESTRVAPVAATCPTSMELFVQTLGGDVVSIHVEQNITIAELEVVVAEATGIVDVEITLMLGVKILDAAMKDCTISDCGVDEGATLLLVIREYQEVLTASLDKTAKIWSGSTGQCKQTLIGDSGHLRSAVFSADGSEVLTALNDKTAKIWNASNGQCRQTLSGHSNCVLSAVFRI